MSHAVHTIISLYFYLTNTTTNPFIQDYAVHTAKSKMSCFELTIFTFAKPYVQHAYGVSLSTGYLTPRSTDALPFQQGMRFSATKHVGTPRGKCPCVWYALCSMPLNGTDHSAAQCFPLKQPEVLEKERRETPINICAYLKQLLLCTGTHHHRKLSSFV